MPLDPPEVIKLSTPCIEWSHCKTPDIYKYGVRRYKNGTKLAHRAAWIEKHGEITKNEIVIQKCNNRSCVNVDHMHLGTRSDVFKRSTEDGRNFNANKTHCPQGHEYNNQNVYLYQGRRYCRECAKLRSLRNKIEGRLKGRKMLWRNV